MKRVLKYIRLLVANIYTIVIVCFGVWMTFFDENSLLVRFHYDNKIHELNKEINFYTREIEMSEQRMMELKSDNKNLEKFARENFLMKRSNEDIFIVE